MISIIITDFVLIPDSPAYHHRFLFYDPKNNVAFMDTQEIHTLELPKLPMESDTTELFDWMTLIRAKSKEDYEMLAQKKPEFEKVVAIVKKFSAEEQARAEYEQREKWRMDYDVSMKYATRKGYAEGEARGEAKRSFAIAGNMKVMGLSMAVIAQATGLSETEIENLK